MSVKHMPGVAHHPERPSEVMLHHFAWCRLMSPGQKRARNIPTSQEKWIYSAWTHVAQLRVARGLLIKILFHVADHLTWKKMGGTGRNHGPFHAQSSGIHGGTKQVEWQHQESPSKMKSYRVQTDAEYFPAKLCKSHLFRMRLQKRH